MKNIISEKKLIDTLNKFRDVLLHYDYSEVDNVIFLNLESLNMYIKTYKNNPFERHYIELEKLFNIILPYIPSNIPESEIEKITEILSSRCDDQNIIKKNIDFNIKMDFIQTVKLITNEKDWLEILDACTKIRKNKLLQLQ